jgi:hypothetical protein
LPASNRSLFPTLSGSEVVAAVLVTTAASIVVAAYLIDRAGVSFTPSLMFAIAAAAGAVTFGAIGRHAVWETA